MKARMRNSQELRLQSLVAKNQKVEVDRTRSHVYLAFTPQRVFDSQQTGEHLVRRGKRGAADLGHHVQKSRLIFVTNRFSFVNTRESNNIQSGLDHAPHGKQ